ncbi:MAG: PilZ domain-containing protein [Candidatus Eremiobacteraeota bacterium]|nr:PilZ domain-containing protein [Candidatus Eremiobacteraeota bacterium]
MKNNDKRQFERTDVALNLRSVQLPKYSAEVMDLSRGGARILLNTNRVPTDLWETRIRFGLSLPEQAGIHMEGQARVVWLRTSDFGVEVGLQWERLSPADIERADALMSLAAA